MCRLFTSSTIGPRKVFIDGLSFENHMPASSMDRFWNLRFGKRTGLYSEIDKGGQTRFYKMKGYSMEGYRVVLSHAFPRKF